VADRRPRVLIPITRARTAAGLLEIAAGILRHESGRGLLLGVVELPQGRPIAQSVTIARRYRSLLQRITELETRVEDRFGVLVRVAGSISQGVREAAFENSADLILLEWPGLGSHRPSDRNIEDLVADPPSDLLLVRLDPTGGGVRSADGVLVPVRGGPSARLALRAAAALAGSRRVPVTALHVHDPRHSVDKHERESREFHQMLREVSHRRIEPVEVIATNPSQAITEAGRHHGVTVLGAFADASRSSVLVGSRLAKTVEALPGTVIVAKSSRTIPPILGDELAPPMMVSGADVSTVVDKWFAENTFHSREFRDIGRLVELKRRQGLTISLGLPTLNEEATIGDIITTLKSALMDVTPLLDEIVVIDSASIDSTVDIARSLGVRVVQHSEVLPGHGSFKGKGEALWKSLHALRGDIVVWCDTDISNIHPQFVYGTVGPLLTDSRISYVKGFYKRPLNFGGELAAGGGRVTELAARPLINLFYPALSGLVQPLSGEYAGRRELLERLPFFSGYGVETGHLIDIVENFGLNRIAQTDLGMRIHRNQALLDLSKMAFAIMQVAIKRLGDRHRIHLLEEINRSMKLVHYNNDRFSLEVREIGDWERPPMATIPEYLFSRAPIKVAN
jgi:glycosyltransferase involved in cell wall biosynthesis/nucleotide-binding universal stress UspA family protein